MKTPTIARLYLVCHRHFYGHPKVEACRFLALALAHRTLDPHANVSRLVAAAKAAVRGADEAGTTVRLASFDSEDACRSAFEALY